MRNTQQSEPELSAAGLPGTAVSTGQTIFEPDDGASLGLVRVQCATCEGGYYIELQARSEGSLEGAATSKYSCVCSNAECPVRVDFHVFGESSLSEEVASTVPAAAGEEDPQTIFHPDDGVPLTRVLCTCGGCGGATLVRESKVVEDLQLGPWTAYSYACRSGGCETQILVRVPQKKTVASLVG